MLILLRFTKEEGHISRANQREELYSIQSSAVKTEQKKHSYLLISKSFCRRLETGGVPKPTSECAACPSPDGSSAWASAKGGSEVAGDGHERGGNPAAFVFVPRPGRVRLQ
jgi:hypothetical protein